MSEIEMPDEKPGLLPEEVSRLIENRRQWGSFLLSTGWTVVPNIIIEQQRALGLDSLDINILLHMVSNWSSDGSKHISKATIAKAMGVAPRTVQRRIAALEAASLIRREERQLPRIGSTTNVYHLDGLLNAAKELVAKGRVEFSAEQNTCG